MLAVDDVNDGITNITITDKETNINLNDNAIISYIRQTFKNKDINSCSVLYNLDDSADYIIVEFDNFGYIIYSKYTLEMLEYNLQGESPYRNSEAKNYYAGPENYFYKDSKNSFINFITGEQLNFTQDEITLISNCIKDNVINKQVSKYDLNFANYSGKEELKPEQSEPLVPEIDDDKFIVASEEKGKWIANYKYFTVRPTIGENKEGHTYGDGNWGTCGPIAAQLLLSYNNYYNNRKIIDDKFLNGYDDVTNSVVDREKNPNYCTKPMTLDQYTTGTRSESSGANSFYCEMISRIMEPNTHGSSHAEVKSGLESYLRTRLSTSEFAVSQFYKSGILGIYSPVNSVLITSEIDEGRPIIISTSAKLGATNHFVVGYGYQNYTYPDGSGTYLGYVTHYGWQKDKSECVWVNSSWCSGYVSLKVNHLHRYYQHQNEYRCSLCKHRTDASIYMGLDDRYYEITANIPQNGYAYKDFYVVFGNDGQKMFQTFGKQDVKMALYDSKYNLLIEDDDKGYDLNSLFYYNVSADVVYYLRISIYNNSTTGRVKIGVTPASTIYEKYEAIENITTNGVCTFTYSPTRFTTKVLTFTPQSAGTYTFETHYVGEFVATCLYLVDPISTNECDFDCDSGDEELQGYLRRTLVANRRYFIIVSLYNPSSQCDQIKLTVRKVS